MEIKFNWHSSKATEEEKVRTEQNMTNEINRDKSSLKKPSKKLTIALFDVPGFKDLTGSAVNENGEEVIKITHQLFGTTTYEYGEK